MVLAPSFHLAGHTWPGLAAVYWAALSLHFQPAADALQAQADRVKALETGMKKIASYVDPAGKADKFGFSGLRHVQSIARSLMENTNG